MKFNKKWVIMGILVVLMLVCVSFTTVIGMNNSVVTTRRSSPLFSIRTRGAIGEKIKNVKENIITRFLGERILFLPFVFLTETDGFVGFLIDILTKGTGYAAEFEDSNIPIRVRLGDKQTSLATYCTCSRSTDCYGCD